MFAALFIVVCFLAYSNGANDNFKGVAGLFGSRTSNYRTALWWACGSTFAGAIVSIFFSRLLVLRFSGQELVPTAVAQSPAFLLSIALGAALTVITATAFGFPISTTHGLVGALIGAGLIASRSQMQLAALTKFIVIPLLFSPIVALVLCYGLYELLARAAARFERADDLCVCAEGTEPSLACVDYGVLSEKPAIMPPAVPIKVATKTGCRNARARPILHFQTVATLDSAHYVSAGLVGFARGMNDTPKIAALMSLTSVPVTHSFFGVAIAMMLGGLLSARKVGMVMSERITPLTHSQGFSASVVTGILVVFASRMGIPVSTTHVSVGSLFGAGVANGLLNKRTSTQIVFAWALTVPVAAMSAALLFLLLR